MAKHNGFYHLIKFFLFMHRFIKNLFLSKGYKRHSDSIFEDACACTIFSKKTRSPPFFICPRNAHIQHFFFEHAFVFHKASARYQTFYSISFFWWLSSRGLGSSYQLFLPFFFFPPFFFLFCTTGDATSSLFKYPIPTLPTTVVGKNHSRGLASSPFFGDEVVLK